MMRVTLKGGTTGMVEIVPGIAVPRQIEAGIDDDTLPYLVEIEVTLEAGKLVCDRLRFERREGGPPITSENIRATRVARLVHAAAQEALGRLTRSSRAEGKSSWAFVSALPVLRGPAAELGPTDDVLRRVAAIYRIAHASGEPPTKTVHELLEVPRSTAGQWVTRARAEGFLGPAEVGRAGEAG